MPFRVLLVAVCPLILSGVLLGAAAPGEEASSDDGWTVLFDGKSLDGWHKNPQRIGHGTGGQWQVEEGVITGQQDPPGSGNGGILLSDKTYGDFELTLELKPDWGICSGLFLRSNDRGQCYQMMVDYHDAGDVGHVYGEGVGGFNTRPFDIFGVYNDQKELTGLTTKPTSNPPPKYTISADDYVKVWKVNQWNTARVRVVGKLPVITTWINGVKICEWDGTAYESDKYNPDKVLDTLGRKGHIALQVHGGKSWPAGAKCRWRNIKIKVLSGDDAK